MTALWVKGDGFPKTEDNKAKNELLATLPPEQKGVLAEMLQDEHIAGIHDTLAYINEMMDLDGPVSIPQNNREKKMHTPKTTTVSLVSSALVGHTTLAISCLTPVKYPMMPLRSLRCSGLLVLFSTLVSLPSLDMVSLLFAMMFPRLLSLLVECFLTAELTELSKLNSIRIVLLVLSCVVVSLLALCAC